VRGLRKHYAAGDAALIVIRFAAGDVQSELIYEQLIPHVIERRQSSQAHS